MSHNNRMQPDFGELALPSAADARRYVEDKIFNGIDSLHRSKRRRTTNDDKPTT